jgi:hypothetical protein
LLVVSTIYQYPCICTYDDCAASTLIKNAHLLVSVMMWPEHWRGHGVT